LLLGVGSGEVGGIADLVLKLDIFLEDAEKLLKRWFQVLRQITIIPPRH